MTIDGIVMMAITGFKLMATILIGAMDEMANKDRTIRMVFGINIAMEDGIH